MSIIFGTLYSLIRKVKEKKIQKVKKGRKAVVSIELSKDQQFSLHTEASTRTPFLEEGEAEAVPQETKMPNKKSKMTGVQSGGIQGGMVTEGEDFAGGGDLGIEETLELLNPTDYNVEAMLESFEGDMESKNGKEVIMDDILQTAKRLKEMKVTRVPAVQKNTNVNLVNLNDEELEALLNDENYDFGAEGMTDELELEFEERIDEKEPHKNFTPETSIARKPPQVSTKPEKSPVDYHEAETTSFFTPYELPQFELPHFDIPSPETFNERINSFDNQVNFRSGTKNTKFQVVDKAFEIELSSLSLDLGADFGGVPEIDWDDF